MIHLDTHVVMWLIQGDARALRPVQHRLDGNALAVSPMVLVELQVLHEIGRAKAPADEAFGRLATAHGVSVADAPFLDVARAACGLPWTRDPFDRLIAATALACNAPLLTRDRTILANLPLAVWE